jgi:hypothetical protein
VSPVHGAFQSAPSAPEQPLRHRDVMQQAPKLMTQIQICREWGICDETWRRWRVRGLTPAQVDLPGRPRWMRSEVETFMQRRRHG